jgi:hypothetical protein
MYVLQENRQKMELNSLNTVGLLFYAGFVNLLEVGVNSLKNTRTLQETQISGDWIRQAQNSTQW